jgi:hypothetical protein
LSELVWSDAGATAGLCAGEGGGVDVGVVAVVGVGVGIGVGVGVGVGVGLCTGAWVACCVGREAGWDVGDGFTDSNG